MSFYDNYIKAGKIAAEIREEYRRKDLMGENLYEICESIERKIRNKGGKPAFPVNVSKNEIAAHYTAEPNDNQHVDENDVLKIDIGVHIDGFIADTAVTICYNLKYEDMVRVAELALTEALKISRSGVKVNEIGKVIENIITKSGFKPIQNLSGHSLEQYIIHAGKSIPNIWTIGSSQALVPNKPYAIEPFVTTNDSDGIVYEGKIRNIFALTTRKPTKDRNLDIFLEYLWTEFKTLPFALRWLLVKYDEKEARKMLDVLIKKKNIHAYPILIERNSRIVVQAEHTIIPSEHSTEIITAL